MGQAAGRVTPWRHQVQEQPNPCGGPDALFMLLEPCIQGLP
jgi:hypothetical protein